MHFLGHGLDTVLRKMSGAFIFSLGYCVVMSMVRNVLYLGQEGVKQPSNGFLACACVGVNKRCLCTI